jgi:anti-sigma B factor antagonist
MDELYTLRQSETHTLVVFRTPSMMNPAEIERIRAGLIRLVEEEKRRHVVLDFGRVQFFSSPVIGILLTLNKKFAASPAGTTKLVLCGVGPRLLELLKISRLDRLLTIKKSRKEALSA